MTKEEQELLELSEERKRENETPEKERDAQDFLEDEFDREFWVEVRCIRSHLFVCLCSAIFESLCIAETRGSQFKIKSPDPKIDSKHGLHFQR